MASVDVQKKEFMVRQLGTQNVTLYPTRAHVVRSIDDLSLTPGSNEITIYGITPTADESSIKVEGTGAATITDMTVDLVDNREHFEDVYPPDSDSEEESDSDTLSESDHEPQMVKDLTLQIQKLELSVKEAAEERNSAQGRLNILENFSRSLTTSRPPADNVVQCVEMYRVERAKAFEEHKNGEIRLKENEQQVTRLKSKKRKMLQKIKNQKAKADRAKSKKEEQKIREQQQNIAEKKRIRHELTRFWPNKVYKVVLCLDANSGMTPISSRRGSIDSTAKTPVSSPANNRPGSDTKATHTCKINIIFSYITYSASWSPRYDLVLDTASKSGSITYRAEFRNSTSETWRETKVVLSTSQTSFQGLAEPIPEIQPWHIRLATDFGGKYDHALYSRHEQDSKNQFRPFSQKPQPPRNQLFGRARSGNETLFGAPQQATQSSNTQPLARVYGGSLFGSSNATDQRAGGGGLFGSSSATHQHTCGFGSSNAAPQPPQGSGVFHQQQMFQAQPNIVAPQAQYAATVLADEDQADLDTETIAPGEATLAFEESTWEESGLTATYTVPGTKTIAPSYTTRRYKVASIPLSSITLSHIIVPKLRTAAFLKARLRNTTSTTLLKGPAGLTLDGTFLGNTTLPRSSPGEAFVLNLGVDPALNVVYNKPTVRRSQSGVFQKEGSCIYTRSCTLTNTKNDTAIEAIVLDQVPVSEDEKLKIEILSPRGLFKEGDQVTAAGIGQINEGTGKKGSTYPENSTGKSGGKWGKASAKLKEGEFEWDVKLNPGQGVKLELEYEARFPSGSSVVGA
ncbi:MAG: hypothetical protein Q9201_001558 [Fulgogasparrea decipioides]